MERATLEKAQEDQAIMYPTNPSINSGLLKYVEQIIVKTEAEISLQGRFRVETGETG